MNDFSPAWLLWWVFKWSACELLYSHREQLNVFSPVCILTCLFKIPFVWITSFIVARWIDCFPFNHIVCTFFGPVSIRNWVLKPDFKAFIEWWKCLFFMLVFQKRPHKTNWKWSSLLATKGKDLLRSIEAAVHKTGFSGFRLTGTGKSC